MTAPLAGIKKSIICPVLNQALRIRGRVSAYITCHNGNDNAWWCDWSGAVMTWMVVSPVYGQFRAYHIDCV